MRDLTHSQNIFVSKLPDGIRFNRLSLQILALLIALSGGCRQQQDRNAGAVLFDPATPVQNDISRGEAKRYLLSGRAGEFIRLQVVPKRTDLNITLGKSGHSNRTIIKCLENRICRFSILPDVSAPHEISIESVESGDVSGSYGMKAVELRQATGIDEKYIEAERSLLKADSLRLEDKAVLSRESLGSYDEAIKKYKDIGMIPEQAIALNNKGLSHSHLSEAAAAIECYELANNLIAGSEQTDLKIEILNNLSDAQLQLGLSEKARESSKITLALSDGGNNLAAKARSLNGMAEVLYAFGDRWKSFNYTKRALPIWEQLNDRRGKAYTLAYLGHLHKDFGDLDSAGEYYEQATTIFRGIKDQRNVAQIITSTGLLHGIRGETRTSQELFRKSLPIHIDVGDRRWEAINKLNSGGLYLRIEDFDQALRELKEARKIFNEIKQPSDEAGVINMIGRCHLKKKEFSEALASFNEAYSLAQRIKDN